MHGGQGFRGKRPGLFSRMGGEEVEMKKGEPLEVLDTFAQGGKTQGNDIEAVIQILAKFPLLNGLGEVPVRCGNDSHVGPARFVFSDPVVFPLLEQPEKLCLDFQRKLADFIQKKSAAIRGGDLSFRIGMSTGEGTPDMAEEFALEEFAGEAWAAHGDEGPVGHGAQLMDAARQLALARAILAYKSIDAR